MIGRLIRQGHPYEGLACYTDDPQLVPRPGFYALDPEGRVVQRRTPLLCVDGRYQHAGIRRHKQGSPSISLHADPTGKTEVGL